jgi:hypothetical protein
VAKTRRGEDEDLAKTWRRSGMDVAKKRPKMWPRRYDDLAKTWRRRGEDVAKTW